ncbi:hypothetical protein M5D96_004949 [Drosophila gunungcola]|uniref:Uncharacterized protein n=1 Tax=Drosophila gunungcola TaxID=103775 RepID=A0A9P9YV23_9MUSC|nr:hypothetical protein M5D96_004949 [Drosophila gunungcola]
MQFGLYAYVIRFPIFPGSKRSQFQVLPNFWWLCLFFLENFACVLSSELSWFADNANKWQ